MARGEPDRSLGLLTLEMKYSLEGEHDGDADENEKGHGDAGLAVDFGD